MPILDHSRILGTETILTPQLLGTAWDNAVQHGPDLPVNIITWMLQDNWSWKYTENPNLVCIPYRAESPIFPPPQREMTRSGLLPCSHPNLEPSSFLQNTLSHIATSRRLCEDMVSFGAHERPDRSAYDGIIVRI